ncbi:STE20-related kinase adapter protein alpha [Aplysia californica]|uniref:STE20-related kinase adapter protein alpha n=1 Tax=Aplysia californica TaxID=6500 RepID=A0ABM0JIK7_APLCA|nr:STE20-related kinase adapter protein alpha [Aplysia californica]
MSLLNCACSKENRLRENRSDKKLLDKVKEKTKEESESVQGAVSASPEKKMDGVICYPPDSQQYELFAVIGKGHSNSSTISLAKHVSSDGLVAVKRINLEMWDRELSYLQNEIVLTQQLSHPNILPFYCSFITQQELWAVMPLMAFGSCRDLMHAYFNSGLPEQAILFVLRDVLSAVEYIHHRGVIHRGIKASHVMISKTGQVRLSGLHNAFDTIQSGKRMRRVHDFPDHTVDCVHCYSPELLEQNLAGYNCKSDMYSIGILTCELANGQSPFSDMPATQMLLEKLSGTKPRLADSTTVGEFIIDEDENADDQSGTPQERADDIFFKRTFSPHLHDFSSLCLEREPLSRPSASQLLSHPVFKAIHNKSCSILPSLLQPVTPLTDISRAPRDVSAEEEDFSRKMSEVSMQDDWAF